MLAKLNTSSTKKPRIRFGARGQAGWGCCCRGGQHVALHPECHRHRGEAAEDGVGHVVGERQTGEAHHRRKRIDHHVRHGTDNPDRKARQHVERHQLVRTGRQTVIESVTGTCQQQGAKHEGDTAAQQVYQSTIDDAAEGQCHDGQRVGGQGVSRADAIDLLQIGGGHQDHHHDTAVPS